MPSWATEVGPDQDCGQLKKGDILCALIIQAVHGLRR